MKREWRQRGPHGLRLTAWNDTDRTLELRGPAGETIAFSFADAGWLWARLFTAKLWQIKHRGSRR